MQSVRGMKDIFGQEWIYYNSIENHFRKILIVQGFSEVRTPMLESIEVFTKGVGEETDIVQKQMYTLNPSADETLVVRPEGTAPFMRAVIQHKLYQTDPLGRYFYYGPMLRHERPQKGRLRQFFQCGVEVISDASSELDAEIIALGSHLFTSLGLKKFDIHINSVGCKECRSAYKKILTVFLHTKRSEFCELCQSRMDRSPLRVFDCKNETCKNLVQKAPLISESLCEACQSHYCTVKECLKNLSISFIEDPHLVRGLDYYTRTLFEFLSTDLGSQSALLGGGRYDDLSEKYGAPPFPGIGFALGMERLLLALEANGLLKGSSWVPAIYFAPIGKKAMDYLYPLYIELKNLGVACHMPYESKTLKALLRTSSQLSSKYTVILGEEELKKQEALIKNMKTTEQEVVSLKNLKEELRRRIEH